MTIVFKLLDYFEKLKGKTKIAVFFVHVFFTLYFKMYSVDKVLVRLKFANYISQRTFF